MKRMAVLVVAGLAVAIAAVASADSYTREVLVQTTPTKMPRISRSSGFEIQNLGPNAIVCAIGPDIGDGGGPGFSDGGVAMDGSTAARYLAPFTAGQPADSWSGSVQAPQAIWCQALTANQVHNAATILTEAP